MTAKQWLISIIKNFWTQNGIYNGIHSRKTLSKYQIIIEEITWILTIKQWEHALIPLVGSPNKQKLIGLKIYTMFDYQGLE